MLVGEQPGDREDREGAPFVGYARFVAGLEIVTNRLRRPGRPA